MTNISPPQKPVVVTTQSSGPRCLLQVLWFFFVGWWLGGLAVSLAWLLNVTIIGLPLGMAILNNIPKILALQTPERSMMVVTDAQGRVTLVEADVPQHNFFVRALFFLLIGWWWSGIWLAIAYLMCALIIFLPVGLWMFRLTPTMTTLRRY